MFKKNINFLVFLFALFEIVLYLGSAGIDGIYRLRWYFDMGEIIGLPIIYTYLYSKVRYPGFLTWIYIISLLHLVGSFWHLTILNLDIILFLDKVIFLLMKKEYFFPLIMSCFLVFGLEQCIIR